MAKLWRCTFNVELVVEAETSDEAHRTAIECLPDAAEDESSAVVVFEVVTPIGLPSGWRHAYPYNGDGERTCEEILRALLAPGPERSKP